MVSWAGKKVGGAGPGRYENVATNGGLNTSKQAARAGRSLLLLTREVVLYVPAFVPPNIDCACHRKQGNPPLLCGFWSECFNTMTGMKLDRSPSLCQGFDSVAAEGPGFAD